MSNDSELRRALWFSAISKSGDYGAAPPALNPSSSQKKKRCSRCGKENSQERTSCIVCCGPLCEAAFFCRVCLRRRIGNKCSACGMPRHDAKQLSMSADKFAAARQSSHNLRRKFRCERDHPLMPDGNEWLKPESTMHENISPPVSPVTMGDTDAEKEKENNSKTTEKKKKPFGIKRNNSKSSLSNRLPSFLEPLLPPEVRNLGMPFCPPPEPVDSFMDCVDNQAMQSREEAQLENDVGIPRLQKTTAVSSNIDISVSNAVLSTFDCSRYFVADLVLLVAVYLDLQTANVIPLLHRGTAALVFPSLGSVVKIMYDRSDVDITVRWSEVVKSLPRVAHFETEGLNYRNEEDDADGDDEVKCIDMVTTDLVSLDGTLLAATIDPTTDTLMDGAATSNFQARGEPNVVHHGEEFHGEQQRRRRSMSASGKKKHTGSAARESGANSFSSSNTTDVLTEERYKRSEKAAMALAAAAARSAELPTSTVAMHWAAIAFQANNKLHISLAAATAISITASVSDETVQTETGETWRQPSKQCSTKNTRRLTIDTRGCKSSSAVVRQSAEKRGWRIVKKGGRSIAIRNTKAPSTKSEGKNRDTDKDIKVYDEKLTDDDSESDVDEESDDNDDDDDCDADDDDANDTDDDSDGDKSTKRKEDDNSKTDQSQKSLRKTRKGKSSARDETKFPEVFAANRGSSSISPAATTISKPSPHPPRQVTLYPLSSVDVTWLADSQVATSLPSHLLCSARLFSSVSAKKQSKKQRQNESALDKAKKKGWAMSQKSLMCNDSSHGGKERIHWINHFPGMAQAVSKAPLARELNRMRQYLIDDKDGDADATRALDFHPKTFLLPRDEKAAVEYLQGGSNDDKCDSGEERGDRRACQGGKMARATSKRQRHRPSSRGARTRKEKKAPSHRPKGKTGGQASRRTAGQTTSSRRIGCLRTLIVKPSHGSQGKGIELVQDPAALHFIAVEAALQAASVIPSKASVAPICRVGSGGAGSGISSSGGSLNPGAEKGVVPTRVDGGGGTVSTTVANGDTFSLPSFHASNNGASTVSHIKGNLGFSDDMTSNSAENDPVVCQVYLPRPVLIRGLKFDIRLYLLVVADGSMDRPDSWLCREGLARLATTPYASPTPQNLSSQYMHLTNYSVNKNSENYVHGNTKKREKAKIRREKAPKRRKNAPDGCESSGDEDSSENSSGSSFEEEEEEDSDDDGVHESLDNKRPLSDVLSELQRNGVLGDDLDSEFWDEMGRIGAHTVSAIAPTLLNSRRAVAFAKPSVPTVSAATAAEKVFPVDAGCRVCDLSKGKDRISTSDVVSPVAAGILSSSLGPSIPAVLPSCFQILGLDILLVYDQEEDDDTDTENSSKEDHDGATLQCNPTIESKPKKRRVLAKLLEVNSNPSLSLGHRGSRSRVDELVKSVAVNGALECIERWGERTAITTADKCMIDQREKTLQLANFQQVGINGRWIGVQRKPDICDVSRKIERVEKKNVDVPAGEAPRAHIDEATGRIVISVGSDTARDSDNKIDCNESFELSELGNKYERIEGAFGGLETEFDGKPLTTTHNILPPSSGSPRRDQTRHYVMGLADAAAIECAELFLEMRAIFEAFARAPLAIVLPKFRPVFGGVAFGGGVVNGISNIGCVIENSPSCQPSSLSSSSQLSVPAPPSFGKGNSDQAVIAEPKFRLSRNQFVQLGRRCLTHSLASNSSSSKSASNGRAVALSTAELDALFASATKTCLHAARKCLSGANLASTCSGSGPAPGNNSGQGTLKNTIYHCTSVMAAVEAFGATDRAGRRFMTFPIFLDSIGQIAAHVDKHLHGCVSSNDVTPRLPQLRKLVELLRGRLTESAITSLKAIQRQQQQLKMQQQSAQASRKGNLLRPHSAARTSESNTRHQEGKPSQMPKLPPLPFTDNLKAKAPKEVLPKEENQESG